MRFFSITDPEFDHSNILLKQACTSLDIDYIEVQRRNFDYQDFEELHSGDALYRVAPQAEAITIEKYLYNPQLVTLYKDYPPVVPTTWYTHVACHAADLAMPKTVPSISSDTSKLDDYVEYLGGYPIVAKVLGGAHGVGVIRIDSAPALYSFADYVSGTKQQVILREYIDTRTHARLIVLGDKVIDSIEYTAKGKDFRTNVGVPDVEPKRFSKEVEELAVAVVHAKNLDFAGVDIILDADDKPYVLEANFPCNFSRAQNITEVDTAKEILQFLQKKSDLLNS